MKKYLATLAFSLFFGFHGISQKEVGDYSFVVVPDTYSFLIENDQYQVNSLTKFLFNKYGFNAYFSKELPDVGRCDGLWADVEVDPGFIWTKMYVVLRDCNDKEVFRSFEGRSKLKEYKKLYHQGLRRAFESISALGVQQPAPVIFSDGITKKTGDNPVGDAKISEEKEQINTEVVLADLGTSVANYVSNGVKFALKETDNGHTLYEVSPSNTLELKGSLMLTNDKRLEFTDATGNVFNASFDSGKNLIIETGFQKVRFTLVD